MNGRKQVAGCIILLLILGMTLPAAVETEVGIFSRYVWRGFDLNPPNKPVVQSSVTYDFGDSGFSFNAWGSISFENRELNELDLTVTYGFSLSEGLSLSAGFIHYGWYFARNFRFGDDTTHEVYVSAEFQKVPLNPRISAYYDFGNGNGIYALLGVTHSLKVWKETIFEMALSLGYNGGQWIETSGFSDLEFLASLSVVSGGVIIHPVLGISLVLMNEVNRDDLELWLGVNLLL